jgi:hypothetical protein
LNDETFPGTELVTGKFGNREIEKKIKLGCWGNLQQPDLFIRNITHGMDI